MLDSAPVTDSEEHGDDADLVVFVDRLAAAGTDRPTALAQAQIRRSIGDGMPPPGVRRLAEALAAAVTDRAPAPRRGEDDPSIACALRTNTLVVLDNFDEAALTGAIESLLADGRRVVVTGPDGSRLDSMRRALPTGIRGRALGRLPTLPCAELRELRGLLATSTPARRARADQQLPTAADVPSPAEIADLCATATRHPASSNGDWLVPGLLSELDPPRRAAVTSVARLVDRSLKALPPRSEREWVWSLLSDLILTRHRAVFDRMLEDTAQAVNAVESARDAAPVTFVAWPGTSALDRLRQFHEYLADGGRARSYFRSAAQREVQPILDQVRVSSRIPTTEYDVRRVIEHLELGERLHRVDNGCIEMGIPAPRDENELRELTSGLVLIAAAARSVGALRHDVLFLASNSPLSVPDLDSAAGVAAAIIEFEVHGTGAEAGRRLEALTERLAGCCPLATMAPEHEQALAALHERDPAAYYAAADSLGAARREQRDELRRRELLDRLGGAAPELADAWTVLAETEPAALGMVSFIPMESLLCAVPPVDSADVVVVLGAPVLGVERLLLAAVAPRMIAVVAPGERPDNTPTLLSVLQRASALVISGRPPVAGAQVVPITAGTPSPRPSRAAAGA